MSNTTVKFFRETGSGPIGAVFAPGEAAKIVQVKFVLSRASSNHGTFSSRHVSVAGEAFSTPYISFGMSNRAGASFDDPLYIDEGDVVDFSFSSDDGVIWAVEVAYEVFGGPHDRSHGGCMEERIAGRLQDPHGAGRKESKEVAG